MNFCLKIYAILTGFHNTQIQKNTYFEEYKPINSCAHCDDKKNVGKVSSIKQ